MARQGIIPVRVSSVDRAALKAAGSEPVSTWLRRLGLAEAKRRSAARSVADTNVVVSGILSPGGKPAAVLRDAGVSFQLVWTPGIVAECLRVLAYPRIAKVLAPTGRQE